MVIKRSLQVETLARSYLDCMIALISLPASKLEVRLAPDVARNSLPRYHVAPRTRPLIGSRYFEVRTVDNLGLFAEFDRS
jgi:hypothetical protein